MPNSDEDYNAEGQSSRQRPNKSVRWNAQDYFSYPHGSGNRPGSASSSTSVDQPSSGHSSETESSDSSDSSDDDEHDTDSANVRAATRANTWFNRLRQGDDSGEESGGEEPAPTEEAHEPLIPDRQPPAQGTNQVPFPEPPAPSSSQPPAVPSIQVSQHPDLNPYSHIMDIGSVVSGGLGVGGREVADEHDPLDAEYRERRNRLLASLGSHSQPSSPQLRASEDLDNNDIPLRDLAPARNDIDEQSPEPPSPAESQTSRPPPVPPSKVRKDAGPSSQKPDSRDSGGRYHQHGESTDSSETASSSQDLKPPDPYNEDSVKDETAREADMLRKKLDFMQRERVHTMDKMIRARRLKRGESVESAGSHGSNNRFRSRRFSDSSSTTTGSEQSRKTREDEEAEELKRLEEQARQEAEEHAKSLVQAHLGSNLLKPNTNSDGYVQNPAYLMERDFLEEDAIVNPPPSPSEDDHKQDDHGNEKSESTEKKREVDYSSSSSDTLHNNEKTGSSSDRNPNNSGGSNNGNNNGNNNSNRNDDSDSDTDDEDRKDISLRGDPDYIPPPKKVKEGVLGSLLRLYAGQEDDDDTKSTNSVITSPGTSPNTTPSSTPLGSPAIPSPDGSDYSTDKPQSSYLSPPPGQVPGSSGKKPKRPGYFHTYSSEDVLGRENKGRPKWYKRPSSNHVPSLSHLASSGLTAASGAASSVTGHQGSLKNFTRRSDKAMHGAASEIKDFASRLDKRDYAQYQKEKEARKNAKKAEQKRREKEKALKKARLAEQARITIHIADVLQRQRFLLRLGRALMLFGAPSHRLEEYLRSTARVLEIDAQVLYIPGCILVSFGDATTHTSETKLIRVTQGLNLAKLHATHIVFKEVVHDLMSLEEASSHIDHLLKSKNIYPWWLVVFFYGLACSFCGLFAYGAYWRDIPIIFLLGGGVGFLQFWVQPRSDLYANVFEVTSSILVSFVGRALGSIGKSSDYVFCFASIVQASIALILPGYIILVGALELQTKNLVAGSVRMFYANIYSLFLSFGITLGSAIFGWCYNGAVTNTTCQHSGDVDPKWKILFVPCATLFLALVNQAGPRQLPVMVIIGSAGYTVQYFVDQNVKASAFTSAIGAFTMGIIGNLYSRVGHGLAFAAILPGIFILVPSGVAAQGSLVAGVKVATEIVNASHRSQSSKTDNSSQTISNLGNSMTQVAVGIVVGLFAATLVVYPLGFKKKRSGLFTF